MKRLLCLLLCALLLAGCATSERIVSPGLFYYPRAEVSYGEGGVIGSEERETAGHEVDYFFLMAQYLHGPLDPALRSALPRNTVLLSAEVDGTLLKLTFTQDLAELSGLDLTIACACVTLTCISLFHVEQVRIQANGALLDGEPSITMDESCLILVDQSTQMPPESSGEN